MNILKEANKRVQKEVNKLSIEEIIKIDMYKYKNELQQYHIKEIQKELKTMQIIEGVSPWSKKNTFLLVDKNNKVIMANDNKSALQEVEKMFNEIKTK